MPNAATAPDHGEHKPSGLFEYILTYHRGTFATLFLLPISLAFSTYLKIRNKIVFLMRSAPAKHAERVAKVQQQIKAWAADGAKEKLTTGRSGWFTMSELVPVYKKTNRKIYLDMYDILEINTEKRTVRVEPQVNMGQITAALNPLGWTLPVVPELDALTVGGLVNGFGVETSSHKYGLFQYICESFELVTADGELKRCNRNENPELFSMIPWSHGTLGFLVAVELKIIPASKFVRVEYIPVHTQDEMVSRFDAECRKTQENDFVEGLVYSKHEGVIMLGKMVNAIGTDGKRNNLRRWYKPWFYKHVEKILKDGKTKVEYVPLRQYYHRHTRSLFWAMAEVIPFGHKAWHRFLFGWTMPPQISLMKYFETETTRRLREKYNVAQDMLMPMEKLKVSLDHFDEHFQLYPIWLSPMAVYENKNGLGFIHPHKKTDGSIDELFVDIGAYGVGKKKGFDGHEALHRCEQFVIGNEGFQAMYAKTLLSHEDFRKMFDHSYYDLLRDQLPLARQAFPDMYHKLSRRARISAIDYKKNKLPEKEPVENVSAGNTDLL
jgi:delta24-sterol reductase